MATRLHLLLLLFAYVAFLLAPFLSPFAAFLAVIFSRNL